MLRINGGMHTVNHRQSSKSDVAVTAHVNQLRTLQVVDVYCWVATERLHRMHLKLYLEVDMLTSGIEL